MDLRQYDLDELHKSDYKSKSRAFHIRLSNHSDETLRAIYVYHTQNSPKIKHILIGIDEYSANKGKHFHFTLSFYNQTTGSAVLKAIFGDFSKIPHYIHPKYTFLTANDGNLVPISYKQFYTYVIKHGNRFEAGTRLTDKERKPKPEKKAKVPKEKKDPGPTESAQRKAIWFKNAPGKTAREFKDWMVDQGYVSWIYDPWVEKLIRDQCRDTLQSCMARFQKKDIPICCLHVFGDTGTCKTLSVQLLFPNHFSVIKSCEKPFDKYDPSDPGHDTIVINEINDVRDLRGMGGLAMLENLADEAPVAVDTKWNAGECYIRPGNIILVGNFTLRELVCEDYRRMQNKKDPHRLYEPLERRYRRITSSELLAKYDKILVHDGEYYDKRWEKVRLKNPRLEDRYSCDIIPRIIDTSKTPNY